MILLLMGRRTKIGSVGGLITLCLLPGIKQVQAQTATSSPPVTPPAAVSPAPVDPSSRPGFLGETPFTQQDDLILLQTRVGKNAETSASAPLLQMVLDTGFDFTVIDSASVTHNKIDLGTEGRTFQKATIVGTGNSSQMFDGRVMEKVIFTLEGGSLTSNVLVLSLGELTEFGIDGCIGVGIFHQLVVEADYANRLIRLYNPVQFVPPTPSEGFTSLPIHFTERSQKAYVGRGDYPLWFSYRKRTIETRYRSRRNDNPQCSLYQ